MGNGICSCSNEDIYNPNNNISFYANSIENGKESFDGTSKLNKIDSNTSKNTANKDFLFLNKDKSMVSLNENNENNENERNRSISFNNMRNDNENRVSNKNESEINLRKIIEKENMKMKDYENKKIHKLILGNKEEEVYYYEGEMKNGIYNGFGLLKQEKEVYKGEFLNGDKVGYGELYNSTDLSRISSITSLKSNTSNSITRLNSINSNFYIGEFENNEKEGLGKESIFTLTIGKEEFEGEFKKNKRNGYGKLVLSNGTIYRGEFKDGEMNGQGELIWKEDKSYIGQMENGKLNGFGIYKVKDYVYIGFYKNSRKEGLGMLSQKKKSYYIIGISRNDSFIGIGLTINEGVEKVVKFRKDNDFKEIDDISKSKYSKYKKMIFGFRSYYDSVKEFS